MEKGKFLYLRNGSIWTGDSNHPYAESVIIGGGVICAVGTTNELDSHALRSQSVVQELNGMSVIPGMSDCHIHVLTSSKWLQSVDLSKTKNCAEMQTLLCEKASALSPDTWIYATSLNELTWDSKIMPNAADIDKTGIPNPVLIHRICTHATVANKRAMEESGICSMNLPGIRRDSLGNPTGILVEGAQLPVHDAMKKALYTRERLLDYLNVYLKHAASLGLTTLHSCSAKSLGMEEELGLYQKLYEDQSLSCRVYNVHDELSVPAMGGVMGNDFVRFEGFKLFLDGSIGARTAAMSFPYADDPSTKGMYIHESAELLEKLLESTRRRDHILSHAIGDGAIDQLLDVVEDVCSNGFTPDYPYLLNHIEICRPDQIERMKKLPVACVIQPTYVYSDIDMIPERLGENEKYACVWKSLIEEGITLCGSSDNPIEDLNPMMGIWSLVTRSSLDSKRTWHKEQSLSLSDALHIYTTNPAKAYSTWSWNGSITKGKRADIVILDRDIFKTPEHELRNVKVLYTLLEGKLSYGSIKGWNTYN